MFSLPLFCHFSILNFFCNSVEQGSYHFRFLRQLLSGISPLISVWWPEKFWKKEKRSVSAFTVETHCHKIFKCLIVSHLTPSILQKLFWIRLHYKCYSGFRIRFSCRLKKVIRLPIVGFTGQSSSPGAHVVRHRARLLLFMLLLSLTAPKQSLSCL